MDVTSAFQPPELVPGLDVTASSEIFIEAIQDSIFKAIESMELTANNSSDCYGNMIKYEPSAFTNELMVDSNLISAVDNPAVTAVSDPFHLLPSSAVLSSDENGTDSSESYSYEILTPVQIYWPESDIMSPNQNSGPSSESISFSDPNVGYYTCDSSSTSTGSHVEEMSQEMFTSQQSMLEDESSSCDILLLSKQVSLDSIITNIVGDTKTNKVLSTSTKIHKCEICSRSFTQAYRLRTHISTVHLGTKPYKCNICSRAFARKSYLQQHGQVHAETKKFKCHLCRTAYARMADYKKHCRKSIHLDKVNGKSAQTDLLVKIEDSSVSQDNPSINEDSQQSLRVIVFDKTESEEVTNDAGMLVKVKLEHQNSDSSGCHFGPDSNMINTEEGCSAHSAYAPAVQQ